MEILNFENTKNKTILEICNTALKTEVYDFLTQSESLDIKEIELLKENVFNIYLNLQSLQKRMNEIGTSKSPLKSHSSRENGKKGGRPRKKPIENEK